MLLSPSALMQDQVTNLCAAGIPAAHLSSALPASARSALMEQLWEGARSGTPPRTRLLLVTPELLAASEGCVTAAAFAVSTIRRVLPRAVWAAKRAAD